MDSPMSTSTDMSSSPCHSTASAASTNGLGAIQKRFKLCNSANASPSKSGLSLNIKPSYSGAASDHLIKCPLCEHKCKDPLKLEEHVNRAHFDPESPAKDCITPTTTSLPCPLCTAKFSTSLLLERHVNHDHTDVLSPMTMTKIPPKNGDCRYRFFKNGFLV